MEPENAPPDSKPRKRGCLGLGGWWWLAAGALILGVGWLLVGHDLLTYRAAHRAYRLKEAQWKQIYDESRQVYDRHAADLGKAHRISLNEEELPPEIKDLGYDECFVTTEGVFYLRSAAAFEIYFSAIHCIFHPGGTVYDRKGVWFMAPTEREWVYVVK